MSHKKYNGYMVFINAIFKKSIMLSFQRTVLYDTGCFAAQYGKIRGSRQSTFSEMCLK